MPSVKLFYFIILIFLPFVTYSGWYFVLFGFVTIIIGAIMAFILNWCSNKSPEIKTTKRFAYLLALYVITCLSVVDGGDGGIECVGFENLIFTHLLSYKTSCAVIVPSKFYGVLSNLWGVALFGFYVLNISFITAAYKERKSAKLV